jgi:hypothetical protein
MFKDDDDESFSTEETGSDELLAGDNLRLPAGANPLVRLHALRAWLNRRLAETELEIGNAALALQATISEATNETRPRRRLAAQDDLAVQRVQLHLVSAQKRLSAYEEAHTLLEECVAHTTTNDRLLVEYYLSLEELVQASDSSANTPWLNVMADVLQRVERVGTPDEEQED